MIICALLLIITFINPLNGELSISLITQKCNCHENRSIEMGFAGIYSDDPYIRNSVSDYCFNEWIDEEILRRCWRQLYGKEGIDTELNITSIKKTSKEYFKFRYLFDLNNQTLNLIKKGNKYPCDVLEKYTCYTQGYKPEFKNVSLTRNQDMEILKLDLEPEISLPTVAPGYYKRFAEVNNEKNKKGPVIVSPGKKPDRSTKNYRVENVISNIPVEKTLNDDKGPATNPKNGIFLFGYYYAAYKDTISFYYVHLEKSVVEKTNCDCKRWSFNMNVFTITRFRCSVTKNGCDINVLDTSISVSYDEAQNHCDNDHSFIRARYPRPTSFKDKHQKDNYILCTNGTVMEEKDNMRFMDTIRHGDISCEPWSMIDTYEQCEGSETSTNCIISDIKLIADRPTLSVKTKPSGFIQIHSNINTYKVRCIDECTITLTKDTNELLITCPNGESRKFFNNKVDLNCPFIDYYLPRYMAVYACKATYRPSLLWAFIMLLFIGCKLSGLIYFILDGLIYAITIGIKAMLKKKCSAKKYFDPAFCEECDDIVENEYLADRHKNCSKSVCPYCATRYEKLKEHVQNCRLKDSIIKKFNKLWEVEVNENGLEKNSCRLLLNFRNRKHFGSKVSYSMYIITMLVIFCILVTPIRATSDKNATSRIQIHSSDNKEQLIEFIALIAILIYLLTFISIFLIKNRKLFDIKRIFKRNDECIYCENHRFFFQDRDHEECIKGNCIYCSKQLGSEFALMVHIKKCKNYKDSISQKNIEKITYVAKWTSINTVGCLLFMAILIISFGEIEMKKPSGTKFNEVEEWNLRVMADDGCNNNCFHGQSECCPRTTSRLIKSNIFSHIDRNKKTSFHKNNLNVNDSFEPILSERIIDLTFETKSESRGQLIVSAKSNINIELDDGVGVTWKLSGEGSNEKIMLNLGIKESGQKYKTKFNSWFADRYVNHGSDNVCTGDCLSDCGCKSKTCRIHKEEDKRNWRCNPTWCWNIGGGCSCCYLEATLIAPKFLIGEFTVEYIETFIDVCISIGVGKYKCKMISHGSNFDIEGVKVKVSKVFGVKKTLPEKIHLVWNVHDKQFDITHPDAILIDADICSASNCRHGEVGDYRFTNLTTLLYEGGEKMTEDGVEMIWGGIQQGIDCVSFHWPSCTNEGVTIQNTDMFDNLIKISKKIHTDFKILESHINLDKDLIPGLNLVVSPFINKGSTEIFLTIDGFRINKDSKKIKIRTFNIRSCKGCKNCYDGFHCIIDLSINEPDQAYIHITSEDKTVIVGTQSLVARKKIQTFNITLFSPIDINELKLCVEETGDCSTKKDINLILPEHRLSNEGTFFRFSKKDDGHFSFDKLGKMFVTFFSNLWEYIKSMLISPLFWIFICIIIVIYIILWLSKWYFGPNRFNTKKINFSKQNID